MKIVFVIVILEIIHTGVKYHTKWSMKQIATSSLSKSLLVKLYCEYRNTCRTMLQEGKDRFGSSVLCDFKCATNSLKMGRGGGRRNHVYSEANNLHTPTRQDTAVWAVYCYLLLMEIA